MSRGSDNDSSASSADHRKARRHRVHWRVAIVRKKTGGQSDIYHGRTHDLSTTGASVFAEKNIFVQEPVVMLLAIPPQHVGAGEQIIEVICRMLYTVMSEDGYFRIGIEFLEFKEDGKTVLEGHLSQRVIPEEKKQYRIE